MEKVKLLWSSLKESIKGTDMDFTKIPLGRAIFLLATPMILELLMEATFAIVDIYYVGKLGASAVATVGLTETYLYLLYSVAMGLSTAVTAIIARRVGEKNHKDAQVSASQAILIGIFVSLPFIICGLLFSKELLHLMGGDEWTQTIGYRYALWTLGGSTITTLLFVINAVFRGAGDAAIAMKVLFISNAINIILDPLFIFGIGSFNGLGIEGAAIATNIGRGVGVIFQFYSLFKGGKHIKVMLSDFKPNFDIIITTIKTSLGGIGQMIIGMTSYIFLVRILASIGSEAVAGSTISLRIMMFSMMPAWGFSNAAATLVGQNLGAGHTDRAEQSVWSVGKYTMVFMILVSIVYFFFHDELVALFSHDQKVIEVGGTWLRILSYSYFIYGWWMVATQAFNGSGDTMTPTKINFVFFWLIQIPLAYFLAIRLSYEHTGLYWAVFFSETSVGLFTLWLFTKGNWKKNKV